MEKIRIILADEHLIIREGVRELLSHQRDLEVIGETSDGEEAVRLVDTLIPDVVIIDIALPNIGGLEVTKRIKAVHPKVAVVVLTSHDEDEHVVELLDAGATGYLRRNITPQALGDAIRAIRSGEFVFDHMVGQKLTLRGVSPQVLPIQSNGTEELTAREVAVLKLAAAGMSNRTIARKLDIEVSTVKSHLMNVFTKLSVGSRTEAVLVALKNRWLKLEDIV